MVRTIKIGRWLALLIGFSKALIPVVYFAYYYDGAWNILDDFYYFQAAELMLGRGYNPLLIFFSSAGRDQIFGVTGGQHVLYPWWNMLAMDAFGPFYSSPIFLNVATTFVSAALLFKIVRMAGFSEKYAQGASIFLLFHLEVLVWSSFLNVKDTLLLMLTLATMYCAILFVRSIKIRHGIVLAALLFTFLWIRYYIPVLMIISFIIWSVLALKGVKKIPWILLVVGAFYITLPVGAIAYFNERSTGGVIAGPFRMLLTPQPWSVEAGASYLVIPSVFNWCLFLPAMVAGVMLFRRNVVFRLSAIYFLVTMVFYGLITELAGPRQRLHVTWVVAWAQFHFLWLLAEAVAQRLVRLTRTGLSLEIKHAPSRTPHFRSQHGRR